MERMSGAGRRAWNGFDSVRREFRQALRAARAKPGYAAAVICILGVVVGANTAMFNILHGVLLQPYAYESGDRLAVVYRS